jgi:hypothetical protein
MVTVRMMMMIMMMMMKMVLLPPRILVDAGSMPSASSPSGSLSEVRFRKFLVSLFVGSLVHLHRVEVFDGAKLPTPDTGGLCPYECLLKALVLSPAMAILPGTRIHFCSFRFAFYSSEITSLVSIFIAPHELGILVKQA